MYSCMQTCLEALIYLFVFFYYSNEKCVRICVLVSGCVPLLVHLWFTVYCLFTVTGLLLQGGFAQLKTDFGGVS